MPLCGGTSDVKQADGKTQEIVDKVKHHVESKINKSFKEFKAIQFSSQVVAGTNYFVKVHVGEEEYLHLRVFAPLPSSGGQPELHGIEYPKTKHDELKYFNPN
uniref:Cystatin B n=1 Tax=Theromyzon tessulatum TaxID=13286 RepID=Q8IT43_THETS|nr:cystatin B [Theromyzon tessulatum]